MNAYTDTLWHGASWYPELWPDAADSDLAQTSNPGLHCLRPGDPVWIDTPYAGVEGHAGPPISAERIALPSIRAFAVIESMTSLKKHPAASLATP
jgi:hypothetical protein